MTQALQEPKGKNLVLHFSFIQVCQRPKGTLKNQESSVPIYLDFFSEQTLSYQSNLPFLALDLLLPLSCVWGSAQFENILSHVYSTLWYGRWENSVQFFSNEFSKTSIYKHYFTSQLDILSKKGFYLFCVKKLLTIGQLSNSKVLNLESKIESQKYYNSIQNFEIHLKS